MSLDKFELYSLNELRKLCSANLMDDSLSFFYNSYYITMFIKINQCTFLVFFDFVDLGLFLFFRNKYVLFIIDILGIVFNFVYYIIYIYNETSEQRTFSVIKISSTIGKCPLFREGNLCVIIFLFFNDIIMYMCTIIKKMYVCIFNKMNKQSHRYILKYNSIWFFLTLLNQTKILLLITLLFHFLNFVNLCLSFPFSNHVLYISSLLDTVSAICVFPT